VYVHNITGLIQTVCEDINFLALAQNTIQTQLQTIGFHDSINFLVPGINCPLLEGGYITYTQNQRGGCAAN